MPQFNEKLCSWNTIFKYTYYKNLMMQIPECWFKIFRYFCAKSGSLRNYFFYFKRKFIFHELWNTKIYKRISIAIQRGNIASLWGFMPMIAMRTIFFLCLCQVSVPARASVLLHRRVFFIHIFVHISLVKIKSNYAKLPYFDICIFLRSCLISLFVFFIFWKIKPIYYCITPTLKTLSE